MRNSSLFILLIVALNACSPAYQQDFYEPDYSQFQNEGVPYRTIDEIESKFVYPEQLIDKQISGNVHSALLVDKFGEVANIEQSLNRTYIDFSKAHDSENKDRK